MFGRSFKWVMVLSAMAAILMTAGTAGAMDEESPAGLDSQASPLEAELREQEAALDSQVGELAGVGSDLEEAQTQADATASRAEDLDQQTKELDRQIQAQEQAVTDSRSRYEQQLQAAYKGRTLQGMLLLLDSTFNSPAGILSNQQIRQLVEDRRSLKYYQGEKQRLRNMVRQLDQKKGEYGKSTADHQKQVEELQRREEELESSIETQKAEKGQTKSRLEQIGERTSKLEALEEEGLLDPPAGGGGGIPRKEELRIASQEIVARPVESAPLSDYMLLYREAAKDYGFGPDWYVLKAVGKIESNHGENMGPSSAGAMGPMQFLPSTWEAAGVDGNGDGVANIMDPEDAIPAAAKYLAHSGAPEDWYAALYAYNHAGWYVREVLEIAERYRLLADDNTVGPYVAEEPAPEPASESPPAPTNTNQPVEPLGDATSEVRLQPAENPEPPAEKPDQTEDTAAPERAEDKPKSERTENEAAPERTEDETSPEPSEDETAPTTPRAEDTTVPQYQY